MDRHSHYDKYHQEGYTIYGRISSPEDHFVEDARTFGESEYPSSDPDVPRKKRKGISRFLTAVITILCFSLTLFLADVIVNKGGLSAYVALFSKERKEIVTFYAVYATHSTEMAISYKNAAAIREEGGAGYVLKTDEHYYVVLNAYESEEDAKSVASKRTNYEILPIEIPAYDVKHYPVLEAAEPTKELYLEAFRVLYQAANDLAKKEYRAEDMKRTLEVFKEKVVASETAYAEKIKGMEDNAAIEYKVVLAEIRSAFENLLSSSEKPVADARYYSVMILHQYSLFAKKFS